MASSQDNEGGNFNTEADNPSRSSDSNTSHNAEEYQEQDGKRPSRRNSRHQQSGDGDEEDAGGDATLILSLFC